MNTLATAARQWADLMGDVLAEVFNLLPLEDRMRTVPLVCKGWRNSASDPACWRNVDIMGWFEAKAERDYWWEFECEDEVEVLVKNVVDRSRGQLRELRATHCCDAAIEHVAENSPSLTVLSIPASLQVTDKSATTLAANCPKLQELDVSDCYNISNQALEAVGKSCTSLVWLGRNMLKENLEPVEGPAPGGDEEAIVMSRHMGNLKHLEMMKTSLSDVGLAHLVKGCGQLETLNLACCSALSPKALENASKECANLKDFTKPISPRLNVNPPDFLFVYFD